MVPDTVSVLVRIPYRDNRVHLFLFDVAAFKRMMYFIIITYSITMLIYLVFPDLPGSAPDAVRWGQRPDAVRRMVL